MVINEIGGICTFKLYLPRAHNVNLCGSFNGWSRDSQSMQLQDDGWWTCRVKIAPGDHEFQYLINGNEWMADFAAHGVEMSGYGCWVSKLWIDPKEVAAAEAAAAAAAARAREEIKAREIKIKQVKVHAVSVKDSQEDYAHSGNRNPVAVISAA